MTYMSKRFLTSWSRKLKEPYFKAFQEVEQEFNPDFGVEEVAENYVLIGDT